MPIENEKLKNIIEAALFAADKPLSIEQMLDLFSPIEQPQRSDLNKILKAIEDEYEQRGIELKQISSGYRFQVRQQYSEWVSKLWEEKPPRYTRALLETLALITYRQPITRAEIEDVRGVAVSTNIMKTLQERGWVKVVGHRDVPGRPALFATTKEFLDYFNLKSMDELPTLAAIKDLDKIGKGIDSASEILETENEGEIKSLELDDQSETTNDLDDVDAKSDVINDDENEADDNTEHNAAAENVNVDADSLAASCDKAAFIDGKIEDVESIKKNTSSDYSTAPEGTLLN